MKLDRLPRVVPELEFEGDQFALREPERTALRPDCERQPLRVGGETASVLSLRPGLPCVLGRGRRGRKQGHHAAEDGQALSTRAGHAASSHVVLDTVPFANGQSSIRDMASTSQDTSLTYTTFCAHVRRNQAVHAVGGAVLERRGVCQLQHALAANPQAGDVVRGSGGVRKLRWGLAGRGKRGGVRVIYYLRLRRGQVWMLTMYAKNEAATIPGPVLKRIKEEIDGLD